MIRYEAIKVGHLWQVVDNQDHIYIFMMDSRYFPYADIIAIGIAGLLNKNIGAATGMLVNP